MPFLSPPQLLPDQLLIVHFRLTEPHYGAEIEHLTLPLLPEEWVRPRPAKVNVTYTPGGAWVDELGLALPTWTISGHTGWRRRVVDGTTLNGYTAWLEFQAFIKFYFDENKRRLQQQQDNPAFAQPVELYMYDFIHDDTWQVVPDGLPTLRHHKEQSLWIRYELKLTGVSQLGASEGAGERDALIAYLDGLASAALSMSDESLRRARTFMQDLPNGVWGEGINFSVLISGQKQALDFFGEYQGILAQIQAGIMVPLAAIQNLVITARGIANNLLSLFPGVKPPAFLNAMNRLNATIFSLGSLGLNPALAGPTLIERLGQLRNAMSAAQQLGGLATGAGQIINLAGGLGR